MVAVMIFCAGCGAATTEPASTSETPSTPAASAPAASATAATEGGEKVLRIGMDDTTLLDPMTNWQIPSYYFYWTVFERLIKLNYDTGESNFNSSCIRKYAL